MLSLGRIQMLLYFSLEDDGKKMAGTRVVSQSGTDLEPGLKIYCSSWGRVRPSEWTHIKIQGLHAAHSQPILNKILKARTWLLLTRSHHLYLFRYFWMDGDMRATWVVQGHGGVALAQDGFLRGHNRTRWDIHRLPLPIPSPPQPSSQRTWVFSNWESVTLEKFYPT